MRIGLMLTARCNARCGHCSTSCGPHRTESLSRETIFRLMDEAADLAGEKPLTFLLSGGEPFLDLELLLEILSHARRLGGAVSCVTNGYWATSSLRAGEILRVVKQAGLRALAVSTSRFHQQFVKRQRVANVLQAAREIRLRCTLKYARLRSDRDDEPAIRNWAIAAGAHDVQDFAVLPHLSDGARLPEDEFLRDAGLPEGPCPAPIITVRENGQAFTCCAPGATASYQSLGSVATDSLATLSDRYYLGGAQQLLRQQGPIHFARAIQARGEGHRLRNAYAGPCDLCTHIATDPVLASIAAETSEEFERRQLQSIVQSLGLEPAHPTLHEGEIQHVDE